MVSDKHLEVSKRLNNVLRKNAWRNKNTSLDIDSVRYFRYVLPRVGTLSKDVQGRFNNTITGLKNIAIPLTLVQEDNRALLHIQESGYYYAKPTMGCMGLGIERNYYKSGEHVEHVQVLQKEINSEITNGYKYDVRVIAGIATDHTGRTRIVVSEHILHRFAYSPHSYDSNDTMSHVTNLLPCNVRVPDRPPLPQLHPGYRKILKGVKEYLSKLESLNVFAPRFGEFCIFGIDIILERTTFLPYVLEIQLIFSIRSKVVRDAVEDVISQITQNGRYDIEVHTNPVSTIRYRKVGTGRYR